MVRSGRFAPSKLLAIVVKSHPARPSVREIFAADARLPYAAVSCRLLTSLLWVEFAATMNTRISELLHLAREIGRPDRRLAILGEGNVSAKISEDSFAVKASGSCLGTLVESDLMVCRAELLLPLLDDSHVLDSEIDAALLGSRTEPASRRPSVESVFHAWLLTLKGVEFVGHCHPTACTQILCSPRAGDFATRRIFPDQVVMCGAESVLVPYTDPGVALAREIRQRTQSFIAAHQEPPRLVLLQNHGIIAVGRTAQAVLGALLMAEKAAEIFLGAAVMGGPEYLAKASVERIAGRLDEHYRQEQLNMR